MRYGKFEYRNVRLLDWKNASSGSERPIKEKLRLLILDTICLSQKTRNEVVEMKYVGEKTSIENLKYSISLVTKNDHGCTQTSSALDAHCKPPH